LEDDKVGLKEQTGKIMCLNMHLESGKRRSISTIRWFQVDLKVERYHGSSGEVRVHYTTTAGTARPSPDLQALYMPSSGWLVFSDGGLGQQSVSVDLLDNGLLEGPQTFFVNITHLELAEPR